jgi:hypothetical protein
LLPFPCVAFRFFNWLAASADDRATGLSLDRSHSVCKAVGVVTPTSPGHVPSDEPAGGCGQFVDRRPVASLPKRHPMTNTSDVGRVDSACPSTSLAAAVSHGPPDSPSSCSVGSKLASLMDGKDLNRRRGLLPTPPPEMMLDPSMFQSGRDSCRQASVTSCEPVVARDVGFDQRAASSRSDVIGSSATNEDSLLAARCLAELSCSVTSLTSYLLDAEQRQRLYPEKADLGSSPKKPVNCLASDNYSDGNNVINSVQPRPDVALMAPGAYLHAIMAPTRRIPTYFGHQPPVVADELQRQTPDEAIPPKYLNCNGNTVFPPSHQATDAIDHPRCAPADATYFRRQPPAAPPSPSVGRLPVVYRSRFRRTKTYSPHWESTYQRDRHDYGAPHDASYSGDVGGRAAEWSSLPPTEKAGRFRDACESDGDYDEYEEEVQATVDWQRDDDDARFSSSSRRRLMFYSDHHRYKDELRWRDDEDRVQGQSGCDGPRWSNYRNRNKQPTAKFVAVSKKRLKEIRMNRHSRDKPKRLVVLGDNYDLPQSKKARSSPDRMSVKSLSSISSSSPTDVDRRRRTSEKKRSADKSAKRKSSSAARGGSRLVQAGETAASASRSRTRDRSSVDAASITSSRAASILSGSSLRSGGRQKRDDKRHLKTGRVTDESCNRDDDTKSVRSNDGRGRPRVRRNADCAELSPDGSKREKRSMTSSNGSADRHDSEFSRRDMPTKWNQCHVRKRRDFDSESHWTQSGGSKRRPCSKSPSQSSPPRRHRVQRSETQVPSSSHRRRTNLADDRVTLGSEHFRSNDDGCQSPENARPRHHSRYQLNGNAKLKRRCSSRSSSSSSSSRRLTSRKKLAEPNDDDDDVNMVAKKRNCFATCGNDQRSPPNHDVRELSGDGATGVNLRSPVGSDWSDTDDIPND